MIINIELPDETVSALIERARGEGRLASDLVTEAVIERFGTTAGSIDTALEPDALESLRRGVADVDAGRTLTLDAAQSEFESVFKARFDSVAA